MGSTGLQWVQVHLPGPFSLHVSPMLVGPDDIAKGGETSADDGFTCMLSTEMGDNLWWALVKAFFLGLTRTTMMRRIPMTSF